MSNQLKAIETIYDGYRFRSRLEARWAVFFKKLGIDYRYELEGFDLDGIWYLPDFYFTEQKCWIEVKPEVPTEEEREKAIRLCIATQKPVIILHDEIQFDTDFLGFFPCTGMTKKDVDTYFKNEEVKALITRSEYIKLKVWWLSDSQCVTYDTMLRPFGFNLTRGYGWGFAYWSECKACKAHGLDIMAALYPCTCSRGSNLYAPILEEASTAARQARFDGRD